MMRHGVHRSNAHRSNVGRIHALLPLLCLAAAVHAQPAPSELLPPSLPWDGASRSLVAAPDDPWITPAEQTGLEETPDYAETVAWLRRLDDACDEIRIETFGKTAGGHQLVAVVAGLGDVDDAVAERGRAVVLVHAGIHAGEIDGKDAGLMLLRDLCRSPEDPRNRRAAFENAVLVFVPVLNVDGHERRSPYSRANQRGPREMGWRTNGRNLNLNRDFTKADTPAVRSLLELMSAWKPDLYVDLHVTDGHDFQYDVTWDLFRGHGPSPAIAAWMNGTLEPQLKQDLEEQGHVPGRMYFGMGAEMERGLIAWMPGPRYSNGYGAVRHLPTILIENHSLKSYDRRVLGTTVFLESLLRHAGADVQALRAATAADMARRPKEVVLTWARPEPDGEVEWLGVTSRRETSAVSGGERVVWTGEPMTRTLPVVAVKTPDLKVPVPRAYWIPPAWSDVVELLRLHGVEMETFTEPREVDVVMDRFEEPKFDDAPFEGRIRVRAKAKKEKRHETFPAGSVRVPTDQPLGELAVVLLEPESPDSLFQWGFFHSIFQRTEYVEGYVLEPLAEKMLAADPALKAEYERLLKENPELEPRERLRWFFERSPYWDERYRLYPVGREE